MDKSVKRIRPSDFELSQVQDNLAEVIQQLLDQANGTAAQQAVFAPLLQQLRGPGTPYSVKTPAIQVLGRSDAASQTGQYTVALGEPGRITPDGVVVPQKEASIGSWGQAVFFGSTALNDCFVIVPMSDGIAFRITNKANSASVFFVQDSGKTNILNNLDVAGSILATGTSTASSMTSGDGFKCILPCGTWWNTTYGANTLVPLQIAVFNQAALGGLGYTPFSWTATHKGSIVGIALNQAGPNAGQQQIFIFKNNVQVSQWIAGTRNGGFSISYPKNTQGLVFNAGEVLTVSYRSTASGNSQVSAYLTLELVA